MSSTLHFYTYLFTCRRNKCLMSRLLGGYSLWLLLVLIRPLTLFSLLSFLSSLLLLSLLFLLLFLLLFFLLLLLVFLFLVLFFILAFLPFSRPSHLLWPSRSYLRSSVSIPHPPLPVLPSPSHFLLSAFPFLFFFSYSNRSYFFSYFS